MAKTPITLTNLPGSDRMFNIPLNAAGDYGVRSWSADTIDENIKRTDLNGGVKKVKKVRRKTLTLTNVIYTEATRRMIEDLIGTEEPIAVNPPWIDATGSEVLTYLSLQKTLDDWREEKTREAVSFARFSSRFNSITGRKTPFGEPHYEDAPRGSGLHVSDVINDHHEPSYELRSYLTLDAEDSGATTLIYVTPAQAVLWDDYGSTVWPAGNKAYLTISTAEESPNTFEIALISAINTTTGLVTLTSTDGTAALTNTSSYTYAKRTYISSVLVSDCEMEDSEAQGSWADHNTPTLVEKSDTQNETGTNCLRVIGNAANDGVKQVLVPGTTIPAGTDLIVWARVKVITGTLAMQIYDITGGAAELSAATTSSNWIWLRYCVEINRGGAATDIDLRFYCSGAAAEFLIDRVYLFQNSADNGGVEPEPGDTYDGEDIVTTSAAATTTYIGNVVDDAAAWDLSKAVIGEIAYENVTGVYGRINNVNDAGDQVTVDAWVGGAPVNGNACEIKFAVAPGWNNFGCDIAADQLVQDDDQHGGTYAQGVVADASSEGIRTAANVFAANLWYFVGAYLKVSAGTARISSVADGELVDSDVNVYTLASVVHESSAATGMRIEADGAAATFLVDDVMVVRLPGNPYDDAQYDLPEPVETTGFTQVILYEPDIVSTSFTIDPHLSETSRRTWDNNAHITVSYDESTNSFRFVIDDGVTTSVSVAETFAAGDSVVIAVRCDDTGAAGDVKIWAKVNTDTTVTNTNAGADILGGLTRIWLGRTANDYSEPARGTVSCLLYVNEVLTDANIEAIIDAFSGADADTGALLAETHGIEYEIRKGGVTTRSTAMGDEFRLADITLVELNRPAALQIQDA